MSLFITSLNSGSNGNCYYVGNDKEAVLVDAGISCREIEKRLARLDVDMQRIKAVFISHEHSDHIKGLEVLARKYQLPVYITDATRIAGKLRLDKELVTAFTPYQQITVGDLNVLAFPKFHDASDPHSFLISGNGIQVGVFTDIGQVCEHVERIFKHCHAAFLETNYDDAMLEDSNYPFFLKQRIRGKYGHLSNAQALELFTNHKSPSLSHLILSHLSKDNNSPELVKNLFDKHAGTTQVKVASRYYETELYCISEMDSPAQPGITPELATLSAFYSAQLKMSLFEKE
jgi:phosphoribosyl 1,2-cyclic phosphodiesterase